MSNVGNTDDSRKSTGLSFGMYRRRVVEQIMGRRDLSSTAKIEAYSIAGMSNHKTWSTLSSSLTTGRRGNLKPDEAAKGRKELLKAGQLRIKKRENGTAEISLVLRKDIETPEVPTYVEGTFFKTAAYRQFLANRSAFLDRVIAAKDLSHSDKVIAFGAGRFIDPNTWTINASYRAIGEAVGYSMETAKLSIGRLFARGYFKKRNIDGRATVLVPTISLRAPVASRGLAQSRWDPGNDPGKDPGKHPGRANLRSDQLAGVSEPNHGDLRDTGDFPSCRRPRRGAAMNDGDLSLLVDEAMSLSASTVSLAAETPSAQAGRSHAEGRRHELLQDCRVQAAPHELPDDFVFDRDWLRSLGVDDACINEEIERFRDWAGANGVLRASWSITWRNWWLSPYQNLPVGGQLRVLKQLRSRGVENADCFWLVRQHYDESKVGLVKIALAAYGPDETWERAIEAIETGEDIGRALWVPDH